MLDKNPHRKGLSFITNRQRQNEGTFCASELAGIEPTPPAPKGAGYVRLDHSATVGMIIVSDFSTWVYPLLCSVGALPKHNLKV